MTQHLAFKLQVVVDARTGQLRFALSGEPLHTFAPGCCPCECAHVGEKSAETGGSSRGAGCSSALAGHGAGERPEALRAAAADADVDGGLTAGEGVLAGVDGATTRVNGESSGGGTAAAGGGVLAGVALDGGAAAADGGGAAPNDKKDEPQKWIWVLDPDGRLYVAAKIRGQFHHSSFLRGAAVMAAGNLLAEHGRLVKLTADSGHYWPSPGHFKYAYDHLAAQGADMSSLKGLEFKTKH